MNLLSFAFTTLSSAAVYALFGLAVVLAYRSSRVLLFCVGEIGVIAAYITLNAAHWAHGTGLGDGSALLVGVVLAAIASAVLGIALYLILGRYEGGSDPFVGTAVTIAFSIALLGLMTILWHGDIARLPIPDRSVALLGGQIPIAVIGVLTTGIALIAILLIAFYRSGLGVELQAVATNRLLAQLRGVPVQRRLATVWIVSAVISGIAGIGSGALSAVSIEGSSVGFSGIVAAIIGGLTSPGGAIVGALLLAAGENLTSIYLDARYSVAVPVIALVALLALRPSGLSAQAESIVRT